MSLLVTEITVTLPSGTVLRCEVLPQDGEDRLWQELGRHLVASYGPGGYFANARGALDYLQKESLGAAYSQMVSELTRLTATKTTPGLQAIDEFRQTPEGLAKELFLRTRKTHPELAEELIRSQLNGVTAWRVCAEMWAALADDHKRRSAPAEPANQADKPVG